MVEVRALRREEIPSAVALLARGFRDNPNPIAAFGDDPARRQRCLRLVFGGLFRVMQGQAPLVALDDGTMVGVTGIAPPGACQPDFVQQVRMGVSMLALGPRSSARLKRWFGAWAAVDPDEPHSHLGPLAVAAHLRGGGIGSRILRASPATSRRKRKRTCASTGASVSKSLTSGRSSASRTGSCAELHLPRFPEVIMWGMTAPG
jgi:ribosomal protein S18 acetylase RimI-like enzyme